MLRLLALIKKEFLAIKNDKKSIAVIVAPPLMQILLFSFAATLDVKNIDLAILDRDGSRQSRDLIREFENSGHVKKVLRVDGYREGQKLIDAQKVLAFLVIPEHFAKSFQEDGAAVQLILDGRRSNTAQIAEGYISEMISRYRQSESETNALVIRARNFYNANLNNFWWILPNLFCAISMIVAILLTSLSVAREREIGTFEQILVSPLRPLEIMMGKLLPALLISLAESTVILAVIFFLFRVPFVGSIGILYLSMAVFLFSISGIGLFISVLAATQQQAILGAFVFLLPSFLLSGFATSVDNMPTWLQPVTDFIPLKYFLILVKGLFLKNIDFSYAWNLMVPMLLFGAVSLGVALFFFKSRTA